MKRLASSGFEEIEDLNSPLQMLKRWDNTYFQNRMTPEQFKAKQLYFQNCSFFLSTHTFISKRDKRVWAMHSEGYSLREIAKKIKYNKDLVKPIVQRLKGLMEGIQIRPVEEGDINFIYATWLRALYYGGSPFYKAIDKKAFFYNYEGVIARILLKTAVKASVACLQDEPGVILGYAVTEPDKALAHFVFVKDAWRKQSIAKLLIPGELKVCTHLTDLGDRLRKKKGMEFDPFKI